MKIVLACAAVVMAPSALVAISRVLSDFSRVQIDLLLGFETFVGLISLSFLNCRVGYRHRDIALLAIPVYGVIYLGRVLWRSLSLPNAYWEPEKAGNEIYRHAAFGELVRLGASRSAAHLCSLALFPFDDGVDAGQEFTDAMGEKVGAVADLVRVTNVEGLEECATNALQEYIELANECGEPYYAARFGTALDENQATDKSLGRRGSFRDEELRPLAVSGDFEDGPFAPDLSE